MDYLSYYKILDYLLELIKHEKLNSPNDFAQKVKCSEKTVRNMINVLRASGHNIKYCRRTKKYFLKK